MQKTRRFLFYLTNVWAVKLPDMKPVGYKGGHGGSFVIMVRVETQKIDRAAVIEDRHPDLNHLTLRMRPKKES